MGNGYNYGYGYNNGYIMGNGYNNGYNNGYGGGYGYNNGYRLSSNGYRSSSNGYRSGYRPSSNGYRNVSRPRRSAYAVQPGPYNPNMQYRSARQARNCPHFQAAVQHHGVSASAVIGNLLAGASLFVAIVAVLAPMGL